MSEAAIVLWIIGFVIFTANVGFICDTAERIAELKFGKPGKIDSKWISVKEKLPTAAGEYLTIFKDESVTYVNYFDAERKEFKFYHEEVGFWNYLPKKVMKR